MVQFLLLPFTFEAAAIIGLCDELILGIYEFIPLECYCLANTCKLFSNLVKIHNQRKWKNLNFPALQSIPYSPQLEMALRFPRNEDEKSKARYILYISALFEWDSSYLGASKKLG